MYRYNIMYQKINLDIITEKFILAPTVCGLFLHIHICHKCLQNIYTYVYMLVHLYIHKYMYIF